MKKNEYLAPEMEIVEIEVGKPLLDASDPIGGGDFEEGEGKLPWE